MSRYSTGYNGTTRTLEELQAWSHWQNLDPELARRTLALLDASILAGRPLGIGSIYRSEQQQRDLFLSRYRTVPTWVPGAISWDGKWWVKRAGVAAAAPPGRSYHEGTTPDGKALAIDFTGDLKFLAEHADAYGLVEFSKVNSEPWHGQPKELPHARRRYVAATMHPLKEWSLPFGPRPAPTKVYAPKPTLRQRRTGNDAAQVRALQHTCNWWGWRDALGRNLIVDGDFGAKTDQAVRTMQRALGVVVDGVYGPQSAAALQRFLDSMVALGGAS